MILKFILQDWKANRKNAKSRYIMVSYRIAYLLEKNRLLKFILFPLYLHHKVWIGWIIGIEIQSTAVIGENCIIYHGQSLVINNHAVIGKNCILRHGVTIGNKIDKNGNLTASPIIGDNCEFGAYSAVIGPVKIGDNVKIGIHTLVNKNINDNSIAVGNPFKIL